MATASAALFDSLPSSTVTFEVAWQNVSWDSVYAFEGTAQGITGRDGSVTVTIPRQAQYAILATCTGYQHASFQTLLRKGEPEELLIALLPGATVSGLVLTEDGAPIAGAKANVYVSGDERADMTGAFAEVSHFSQNTTTDAAGAFVLSGLRPADVHYRLNPAAPRAGLNQVRSVQRSYPRRDRGHAASDARDQRRAGAARSPQGKDSTR